MDGISLKAVPALSQDEGPPARIAAGVSSSVYRLSDDRVAKIFHDAVSNEMIAREFAAATLAAEAGLPVARPLERLETPKGRAILFPEIAGPTVMRDMRSRPLRARSRIRDMARLHRQINACAAPELRPLKQVLRTDILHGPVAGAVQDAALDLLDRLPDGDRLLHGDFHIRNVILSPAGLVAIDWSKAARGPVTPDLLRAEMLFRFGEGPQDDLTNIARDWAARHYVASYSRLAGEGLEHVPQWRAVVALAWLRARARIRPRAFMRYLQGALGQAGLPPLS